MEVRVEQLRSMSQSEGERRSRVRAQTDQSDASELLSTNSSSGPNSNSGPLDFWPPSRWSCSQNLRVW